MSFSLCLACLRRSLGGGGMFVVFPGGAVLCGPAWPALRFLSVSRGVLLEAVKNMSDII